MIDDAHRLEVLQDAEVEDDDDRDEHLEDQEELALLQEVGLAGLVDQLRDLGHRLVDRQPPDLVVDEVAEEQAAHRDQQAQHQQRPAVDAHELRLGQVRQHETGLAAVMDLRLGLGGLRLGCLRQGRRRAGHGDHRQHQRHHADPHHQPLPALPNCTHGFYLVDSSLLVHPRGVSARSAPECPRSTAGRAIPPVRITRTPSSTARSGYDTALRGTMTRSPR